MTYTYKLARRIALLRDRALWSSLALAAACGGTDLTETDPGSPPSQAPSAALVVIPQTVTIETNQTVSFAARDRFRRDVAGTVQWAVSGGRISHDGAFTSSEPGTFMLVGRIQGVREQFPRAGTARVRVVPAQTKLATIRVSPENVRLPPGGEQAFEVSGYLPFRGIYGTFGVPIGVTWTATGGRVDASGLFTAGDKAGTFKVIAKSVGTGVVDTVMGTIDTTLPPPVEPAPNPALDPTPDPTPDSTPTPAPVPEPVPTPTPAPVPELVPTPMPTPPPSLTEKVLIGVQGKFDNRTTPFAVKTLVNADRATWAGKVTYPINWAGHAGGVWRGGSVTGLWDQQTTSWVDGYHSYTAFYVRLDSATVMNLRVHNYGDAVRFTDQGTRYFTLRASWFSDIHDDCMEDDRLKPGLVEDNLFDGCHVGISMRPGKADQDTVTGVGDTLVIRNNLIRLKPFAHGSKPELANTHGGFFKVGNAYPQKNLTLILEGNIFRADMLPGTGSLCLNQHGKVTRASGNIVVWLGAGSYPCTLPPGWTLTRDVRVWNDAVAAWKSRH